MTWPALSLADYIALIGMLSGALLFIFKMIQRMRTNDLFHLDTKIDLHHAALMETVTRIEGKIDEHVRDHAAGVFR